MGCMGSGLSNSQDVANRAIERQLRQDAEISMKEVKLLLLGAGECGKSTILKQMQIIHGKGYTEAQRREYVPIVYVNVVQSMINIVNAMETLSIDYDLEMSQSLSGRVHDYLVHAEQGIFTTEMLSTLQVLWSDRGIRECYKRSKEFQLNDSAGYYFDALERIARSNYLPTELDILRSRVKTTGIVETYFNFKDLDFKVFDVGGQRSERKKWMHCFEGITAVLFLVAMSEYDLKLMEDQNTNRMHESMRLFDSICNSQWFLSTSIILFLNKRDLFEDKITYSPLKVCFKEYTGSNTYEETSQYMRKQFEDLNLKKATKSIYTHFTCATDTNNIKVVFEAVIDIIIKNNLKDCGLF